MVQSRRHWLKAFAAIGTSSLLIHPSDLLALEDSEVTIAENMTRLSSNENPYSPSPAMSKALSQLGKELCRYPNRHFSDLQQLIAEREGIDPEHIVVTSGSREGLNAVGLSAALANSEIVTCLPTYKALLTYAEKFGCHINAVPLTEDMMFNLPGIKAQISDQTGLVFICNPNNPTGTLLPSDDLISFCHELSPHVPVFVDEAYYDYIEEPDYPSMKQLFLAGQDVIVSRTYSKVYGLAGARIGYMMARKDRAREIRQRLMSGTNVLGLRLGMVAVQDDDFRQFSLVKNREAKQMIYKILDDKGLTYLKSHANFIFFRTGRPIDEIQEAYRKAGIIVGRAFPPYDDWCRISTGTIEEVQEFIGATGIVFR